MEIGFVSRYGPYEYPALLDGRGSGADGRDAFRVGPGPAGAAEKGENRLPVALLHGIKGKCTDGAAHPGWQDGERAVLWPGHSPARLHRIMAVYGRLL